eukprot:1237337-Amphidinium_carterae.1
MQLCNQHPFLLLVWEPQGRGTTLRIDGSDGSRVARPPRLLLATSCLPLERQLATLAILLPGLYHLCMSPDQKERRYDPPSVLGPKKARKKCPKRCAN